MRTALETCAVGDSWISDEAGKARALAYRFFPYPPPSSDIPAHEAVRTRVAEILTRAGATEIPNVSRTELHAAIWASGPWKAPGDRSCHKRLPSGSARTS